MPRLRHYDHLGTARFVTFCCYHRYQLLTDSNDIRCLVSSIEDWRWSSYGWYHGAENVALEIDGYDS